MKGLDLPSPVPGGGGVEQSEAEGVFCLNTTKPMDRHPSVSNAYTITIKTKTQPLCGNIAKSSTNPHPIAASSVIPKASTSTI